jgi:hypothetical protein
MIAAAQTMLRISICIFEWKKERQMIIVYERKRDGAIFSKSQRHI